MNNFDDASVITAYDYAPVIEQPVEKDNSAAATATGVAVPIIPDNPYVDTPDTINGIEGDRTVDDSIVNGDAGEVGVYLTESIQYSSNVDPTVAALTTRP
ncbi:UNVERIFIED_CONTAM: hypothetical protein HDU68_012242 [Siphonaria sp. JEL0065]|nr:hypothetical protein HDU68_012242 [Siphonaria sp. JEL0065]